MNNYKEAKQKLDSIRDEYGCKGEVIFRTAIQMIVEYGQNMFNDKTKINKQFDDIDARHNKAEAEGKCLFMSREFEKALIKCAVELAKVKPYDFLTYIQQEVWLGGNGISYQRAIELTKNCIESIYSDHHEDCEETLDCLYCHDFSSEEIEDLGYGFLFGAEEEED